MNLVEGLVHVSHYVKEVEDMDWLTSYLRHDTQVRFSHVAADELEPSGTFLADPQQPTATGIDLVAQGQILMLLLVVYLVDADGGHVLQFAMRKTQGDGHFYRTKNIVPGGFENFAGLFVGQIPRPAGQKPGIGGCQVILSFTTRHLLNLYPTAPAITCRRA